MKILYKHRYRLYYYSDKSSVIQMIDIETDEARLITVKNPTVQFEILTGLINHLVNPTDDRRCIVLDN